MRKTHAILFGAIAGLGLTAAVNAAPIVNTRLSLYTVDSGSGSNLIAPGAGGVYSLSAGQHFLVMLGADITPGTENFTDSGTGRATLTRNKPLGIQNLTADIRGSGVTAVTPVATSGQWANYLDQTPDGLGYPFVNVNDSNGDGKPDASGAGFQYSGTFAANSTATLNKFQYGATTAATPTTDFLWGEFVANGNGTINVVPALTNVYQDDAANNNNFIAVDATAQTVGTSVTIQTGPVPEPASLGLLSLVGLALGRRRRA
jgi:hypothetical protein